MSAPASSWRATAERWLRGGAAAVGSAMLDAALDSLELGKRALAWVTHLSAARVTAVVLVIALASGALWVTGRTRRAQGPTLVTGESSSQRDCP
jgi:hypothetical protein